MTARATLRPADIAGLDSMLSGGIRHVSRSRRSTSTELCVRSDRIRVQPPAATATAVHPWTMPMMCLLVNETTTTETVSTTDIEISRATTAKANTLVPRRLV